MGDVLSPFIVSSPPPPSSPSTKNNSMPMLYYGLVVVATAAIVLAIYNLVLLKRGHVTRPRNTGSIRDRGLVVAGRTGSGQQRNLLLSSFKYKKEVVLKEEHDDELECSVCLSVYEEGEEVRKLPECKHCFHVICIDMWLYSHFDCPICRTPVILFPVENSSHGMMMESGGTISL